MGPYSSWRIIETADDPRLDRELLAVLWCDQRRNARVINEGNATFGTTPTVLPRWDFATEQIFKDLTVLRVSSIMPRLAASGPSKLIYHLHIQNQRFKTASSCCSWRQSWIADFEYADIPRRCLIPCRQNDETNSKTLCSGRDRVFLIEYTLTDEAHYKKCKCQISMNVYKPIVHHELSR